VYSYRVDYGGDSNGNLSSLGTCEGPVQVVDARISLSPLIIGVGEQVQGAFGVLARPAGAVLVHQEQPGLFGPVGALAELLGTNRGWARTYQDEDGVGVVAELLSGEIDIAGGAAITVRREQHATFEDELVPDRAHGESSEETFQDVQLDQLIGRPTRCPRLPLSIQVRSTARGISRDGAHSRISNV
jgi:hypothetical protein